MVATRSARFSRCVLRCQGSRSPSTALMLRAACSIPPIQTPNPSKNGPSSSRYPTVNHFRPKPIGGEVIDPNEASMLAISLEAGPASLPHRNLDKAGRSVHAVLTAAPAATLGGPALAQLSAPAQISSAGQQALGFYRYKVGDVEVTAIHDGFAPRPLDGLVRNADINDVKEAMADAFLPTDVLPITFTTLALRAGGRLILIDTGNGDSGAPTTGRWMANFRAAGFDPAQVNTVIISHFHPDHINGLRLKDGTAVFPNAEVMAPAPEWAFWMDDGKMAQAPDALKGNFQNVRRVFGPMAKDVKQYEAGQDLAPGVTAVAAPGHTPGHTVYAVSSGNGKLLVVSDITNLPPCSRAPPIGRRCSTWTGTRPATPGAGCSAWRRRSAPRSRSTTRRSQRLAMSPKPAAVTSSCPCSGPRRSEKAPQRT